MNLKDYLAFKDAHQRGDKRGFALLVVEHWSDVMEAIRDYIGAATTDDPPLVQYKDPVLIKNGSIAVGGWAHRGGSALDAKLSQADVFSLLEVGSLLAERTHNTRTLSVAIIKPEEGLALIDDELTNLKNSTDRQRRESWRLQRIRANLDGLVK